MTRLNSKLGSNKEAKFNRRNILINELDGQVIFYNQEDWLCISKFNKEDLDNEDAYGEIFYNFLNNFLRYAFTIEKIIKVDKRK